MKAAFRKLATALVMILAGFGGGCPYVPKSDLTVEVDGAQPFRSDSGAYLYRSERDKTATMDLRIWPPWAQQQDGQLVEFYEVVVVFDLDFFEAVEGPVTLPIAGSASGESRGWADISSSFESRPGHDPRILSVSVRHVRSTQTTEPQSFTTEVAGSFAIDDLVWETSASWHNPKLFGTLDLAVQGGLPPESPGGEARLQLSGKVGAYVQSTGW